MVPVASSAASAAEKLTTLAQAKLLTIATAEKTRTGASLTDRRKKVRRTRNSFALGSMGGDSTTHLETKMTTKAVKPSLVLLSFALAAMSQAACVTDNGETAPAAGEDAGSTVVATDAGAKDATAADGSLVMPPTSQITATISSPSGAVFTNGMVTVQVAVTGAPTQVELLKDGMVLATLTAPYQYTWDTKSEAEKTYSVSARASKPGVTPVASQALLVTVDRTAPTVVSQVPANMADNVFLGDEMSVTFSEPITAASVNAASVQLKAAGSVATSTATLDAAGTKLVIRPTSLPALDTKFSLVLSGLKDRAGNTVAAPVTEFTVPTWPLMGGQLSSAKVWEESTGKRALAVDGKGNPVMAWSEVNATTNMYNLYVKRWESGKWVSVGTSINLDPMQNAFGPSMVLDPSGNPIVAWQESTNAQDVVAIKRWDGAAWIRLGAQEIIGINPRSPSLALDSTGAPVVAWASGNNGLSVVWAKRWNGASWTGIGPDGLVTIAYGIQVPSLALDPQDTPVVAWEETTANGAPSQIQVKRFSGEWTPLGTGPRIFSGGNSRFPSLVVGKDGKPLIAWSEEPVGGGKQVYVNQWDGAQWVGSGSLNIDGNMEAGVGSLTVDPSNHPIVSWSEYDGARWRVRVKRQQAGIWMSMGPAVDFGVSSRFTAPSMALDPSGLPVVGWCQRGGEHPIYVKRFNRLP
jgi:Bacterial Ig-like domain/Bacterial Ig domain